MGAGSRMKSGRLLASSVAGFAARAPRVPTAVMVFAALFVVVVVGVVYGWQRWGRTVVARPIYRIAAENIHITPPPPWIRSDIRAEVVQHGSLNDLTIFDKDAAIRVYQAFELHPWVLRVKRVSKHPPARLDVDLEYRRPVAWVEVPRGVLPSSEGGVIPVDQDAVVLPSRDFTQQHVADYLRISIPGIPACGLAGTPWGDPRVAGAARIATLLEDSWRDWKLFRIRVSATTETSRRPSEPLYEIETRDQRRIIWGRAPDAAASDEPSPQSKLDCLTHLLGSSGGLDQPADVVWDLRTLESAQQKR